MNRLLVFCYIFIGFIGGFALGSGSGPDAVSSLKSLLTALSVMMLGAVWQWSEKPLRERRSINWHKIRSHGKAQFVIFRFVLARGIVILVFIFTPFFLFVGFPTPLLGVFVASAVLLFSALAYIGQQEWLNSERTFHTESVLAAAQAKIGENQ